MDIKEQRKESIEEGYKKHKREVTPKERKDYLEEEDERWRDIWWRQEYSL